MPGEMPNTEPRAEQSSTPEDERSNADSGPSNASGNPASADQPRTPEHADAARIHDLRRNIASADRPAAKQKNGSETPSKEKGDSDDFLKKAASFTAGTVRVGGGAAVGVGAAAGAALAAISRFGETFFSRLYTLTMHPGKFVEQVGGRYKEAMAKPPKGKGAIKGFFSATGWTLFGDKPHREEKKEKKKEEKKDKK